MIALSLIALLILILTLWAGRWRRWPKRRRRGYGRRAALAVHVVRGSRKPEWVIGRLVRLKALMPEAGCRRIADVFNRRFVATRGVRVSKSFVAYTLRARRHEIEQARRDIRARRARAGPRNRVWGLDLTGKRDGGGEDHAILGLIDHGTRRLLTLRVAPDVSSWSLLGPRVPIGKGLAPAASGGRSRSGTPGRSQFGIGGSSRFGITGRSAPDSAGRHTTPADRGRMPLAKRTDRAAVRDAQVASRSMGRGRRRRARPRPRSFHFLVQCHPPAPEPGRANAHGGLGGHRSLPSAETRRLVQRVGRIAGGVPYEIVKDGPSLIRELRNLSNG